MLKVFVSKPALQILAKEATQYDNVFVSFRAFHLQLPHFGGLSFIMADSVTTQILADTGVLAAWFVSGLISWKHYSKCKRIHMLHFKIFVWAWSSSSSIHGEAAEITWRIIGRECGRICKVSGNVCRVYRNFLFALPWCNGMILDDVYWFI